MKYNPYSVSKLGTFKQCPLKFKYQYIDKVKVPRLPNKALKKGGYVHEILEHNFNYDIEVELDELFTESDKEETINMVKDFEKSYYGKYIKSIYDKSKKEEDFAFDKNLKLVGYWDKNAWLRGSADLYFNDIESNKYTIIDYKTGKDHSEDELYGNDQGMMYAIAGFLKYPNVNTIDVKFIFVEHSTAKEMVFYRAMFNEYIKDFYNKTKKIENSDIFNSNPSALCDFCDFQRAGVCKVKEELDKTEDNMLNQNFLDF